MNRSMSRSGLRPIQLKQEVARFAWIAQPAYRAPVLVPVQVRVEQIKKRVRPL